MKQKKPHFNTLTTPYESSLEGGVPFCEYPRPQLKRESYLCLNGSWRFTLLRGEKRVYEGNILVPFPPESRISGVCRKIGKRELLIYERTFTPLPGEGRLILHFGACDQTAQVFVNGKKAGEHSGGYLPFSFDITDLLTEGENLLRVEARDPMDLSLPYGKQTKKRGGMWYTKVSGIWQTVWLERVPDSFIRRITLEPDLHGVDIRVEGGGEVKRLTYEGGEYLFTGDHLRLEVPSAELWTPESPRLYPFTLESGGDRVESYFALRTVGIGEENGMPRLLLNGKPYFFHALLDQGYFPDGIFLPADPRGFLDDILRAKECGFNTLRKHIKIEPELFYYYCDRHGCLVMQDAVNSGSYSFLIDTALPTLFLKKGVRHRASKRRRDAFFECALGMTELLRNHPSVVYYTVFNEGWGQFDADGAYERLKACDPSRIWDATSGWFKEKKSDVESLHVYFKPIKIKASERPTVLSEFGGYSMKLDTHSFNLKKTYGYRKYTDLEVWQADLEALYTEQIAPALEKGLCGAVLTQLSDVEDETNGLLTYDRRVLKCNAERMRAVAERLKL